tara:strand:+ start:730 stop:1428 length:699 start_codon:yes stop_codon:yes gene_type:complete
VKNRVVYTSIFGGYDDVDKFQTQNIPQAWDLKCFSENNSLSLYSDNTRNAKRFKVLPHRYLEDYEYSIFIDGNMTIVGNIDELIEKYLNDSNVAFFSHSNNLLDSRNCPYDEANFILEAGVRNYNLNPSRGVLTYKDNPNIIEKQMQKYESKGFPKNNGLITGMVILRRHNEVDCIQAMEDWWTEIKYNSKRDQLSFNYVAWKNNLKFNYIDGDSRNNKYFIRDTKPHKGKK